MSLYVLNVWLPWWGLCYENKSQIWRPATSQVPSEPTADPSLSWEQTLVHCEYLLLTSYQGGTFLSHIPHLCFPKLSAYEAPPSPPPPPPFSKVFCLLFTTKKHIGDRTSCKPGEITKFPRTPISFKIIISEKRRPQDPEFSSTFMLPFTHANLVRLSEHTYVFSGILSVSWRCCWEGSLGSGN